MRPIRTAPDTLTASPLRSDHMTPVLGTAWRTLAFGWRFGSGLVVAAVAGIVGILVGFVMFAHARGGARPSSAFG